MPGVTGQVQSYLMNGRVSRRQGQWCTSDGCRDCVSRAQRLRQAVEDNGEDHNPDAANGASPISRRPIPRSTI